MSISFSNVEAEGASASLLELAANNDLAGFKNYIDREPSIIDEVGLWYGRQNGSSQMVLHRLTPLMVAATYGSIDILKLIVSSPEVDVNRNCGVDNSTALHSAASSGSVNAVDAVKLLLAAGADPNLTDANGRRPFDVIAVSPKSHASRKYTLQTMLDIGEEQHHLRVSFDETLDLDSPPLSPSRATSSAEKKEYPVDPSLPDIKNGIYSTDEFRMFSFKIRPCSRAYSHDWTECPFVHPGENARRRDPRKYHYSCVPCPDFRKGACRRADMCEYAHGVFECWLHPAQYRTRLCKDGTSCNRRVCFFAHTHDELRPLYVSTGSAVPSPRSIASGVDFTGLPPSPFTPPMSPSANGGSNANPGWPSLQNVPPALHLPGSNFQSSRLRSSFNARDLPLEDMNIFGDIDIDIPIPHQQNELSLLSQPSINRSVRPRTLTPSNLDDIFSGESSSPRYSDQAMASAVFSPRHQFQQQSMLSPIKTTFSPRNVDQSPFGVPSSGRMSPRTMEPISPMSARASMIARHEKQQQFRSLSSRDLGSNAAAAVASLDESWSKWGSPNGQPQWAVNGDDYGKLKRSSSFELLNNGEEPDLSWVHTLVKEDTKEKSTGIAASSGEGANLNKRIEQVDQSVLGAWLEQMQLDQLMAQ